MPGIYGVIKRELCSDPETLVVSESMKRMLTHFPWYTVSEYHTDGCGFGLISVKQDSSLKYFEWHGEKYVVLVDGFIYSIGSRKYDNYDEIISKVIEIVYEDREALASIRGNYVIAVYSVSKSELFLFNDRIGARRLYYADLPNMFVFSPEMKAISFLPQFERKIDLKGLADFLNFGYVLGDDTLFKGIRSLSSASYLRFDQKKKIFEVKKYWRPVYTDRQNTLDENIDQGLSLIRHSISEKIQHADSLICPISGGLDSRLILATLHQVNDKIPVKPVTYGQSFSYEYKNAVKVCRKLGYDNHQLVSIHEDDLLQTYRHSVWFSEGMIPMTNCHLLLLPGALGGNWKSVLNGIYGGPTNYSAEYYRKDHIESNLSFEGKIKDIQAIIALRAYFYEKILPELSSDSIAEYSFRSISDELKKSLDVSGRFCDQRDAFFIENRMRRCICQSSLYRFFWDEHLPLSNYDLYEFYLSTPPELKLERNLLKGMIKRGFPAMASISDANTGLNLYEKPSVWYIQRRKFSHSFRYYLSRLSMGHFYYFDKSTYAHYDIWFQKNKRTRDFFIEQLFVPSLREAGLFNGSALDHLFNSVKVKRLGFHHLVRLTTFAMWYALFIQQLGVEELREDIAQYYADFKLKGSL